MSDIRRRNHRGSLLAVPLLLVVMVLPAARRGVAAEPAAPGAPPAPAASGQASGALVANGKTYTLAHAAAFVDAKDPAKPVVLLLTDSPVPADVLEGKSSISTSQHTVAKPWSGVVFWLDKDRAIVRCEFYEKDEPTSVSGLFALKLEAREGPALIGSATATDAAAKQKSPLQLNATFNAIVK